MNPRIHIESDGTLGGSRAFLDDGTEISKYVSGVEWTVGQDGIARAKLTVLAIGGKLPAELVGLNVKTLKVGGWRWKLSRWWDRRRAVEVTHLGAKARLFQ